MSFFITSTNAIFGLSYFFRSFDLDQLTLSHWYISRSHLNMTKPSRATLPHLFTILVEQAWQKLHLELQRQDRAVTWFNKPRRNNWNWALPDKGRNNRRISQEGGGGDLIQHPLLHKAWSPANCVTLWSQVKQQCLWLIK